MSNNLLMAQAFGDAIGASKRQVQHWTDRGAIRCVPGTDQQGRGKQRLYDEREIPLGRLITQIAAFQLPIGRLIMVADFVRTLTNPRGRGSTAAAAPGGFPSSWHIDALAGERESFICLRPGVDQFAWWDRKQMERGVKLAAMIVIPVHQVVKTGVPL